MPFLYWNCINKMEIEKYLYKLKNDIKRDYDLLNDFVEYFGNIE